MSRRTLREVKANDVSLDQAEARAHRDEIEIRAYELWLERGCPAGSPEIDWLRAEEEVKNGIAPVSRVA